MSKEWDSRLPEVGDRVMHRSGNATGYVTHVSSDERVIWIREERELASDCPWPPTGPLSVRYWTVIAPAVHA